MSTDWQPASGGDARAELQRQNSRLQLLLNLTGRITSNLELQELLRALTASKGRVGGSDGAAARLGLNRTTLLSRLKKLGIDPKQFS